MSQTSYPTISANMNGCYIQRYSNIWTPFGVHTHATGLHLSTTQCTKYNSIYADPASSGIDALAQMKL